jgi:hypothetical protein
MRYLAFSPGDLYKNDLSIRETTLWDVHGGRALCSFPLQDPYFFSGARGSYAQAFTQDETTFVEFARGKAHIRDVVTGDIKKLNQSLEFPHGPDEHEEISRLRTDGEGRLLVMVKEIDKPWRVRDLFTGEEVGSFILPPAATFFDEPRSFRLLLPDLMHFEDPEDGVIEIREVPTGKMLFQWKGSVEPDYPLADWMITPDGKTRVMVDDAIHVYDNKGGHRDLNVPAWKWPVLSLDGRLLLVEKSTPTPNPWFAWLWNWFTTPKKEQMQPETGLYDLERGTELASFPNSHGCLISQDIRKFAIFTGDSLNIYDLPLSKPWAKIAGYALRVAGGVFLVGLILGFLRGKKPNLLPAP